MIAVSADTSHYDNIMYNDGGGNWCRMVMDDVDGGGVHGVIYG